MPGHLDHAVVNSFVRGLRYPLTRDELVRLARANDITGEYLTAFQSLPETSFASQAEVMEDLQQDGYSLS